MTDGKMMKMAYADPPYLGCGQKFYAAHHPNAADWDNLDTHRILIDRLCEEFPDGWAMSLTSSSLKQILPLCPDGVRIGAWVKPFAVYKKGVRPAYAWEPVIFRGGRNKNHPPPPKGGEATTPKDWIAANITLKRGLTGAKPRDFCRWMFDLLNLQKGDEFVDIFSGTGAVMDAWQEWVGESKCQVGLFAQSEGASP